jgi:hypothetical protein
MAVPNPTKKPTTAATGATTLQPVKATSIPDPLAKFGGRDAYVASQNKRWQDANASNNASLMSSLQADAKRVGYTLNPYKAPSTTTPNATQAPTSPYAEEYSQWKTKMNDALSNYEKLAGGSFSYDPNTDPKYQAMQTLAKQRAGAAKQSTMEDLNSRGILNSSVTASQLGQIEQAAEQEALAYIPQYEAMARQDYQNRLSSAANLLNTYGGLADTAYNRDYTAGRDARADMESDRNYNRGVLESDRNFEYQQNRQQFDQDVTMAELTGRLPDGTPTNAYQQQQLANLWTVAEQTGVIPNELADMYGIPRGTQTQAAKQFALNYALDEQRTNASIANQEAQTALDYQRYNDSLWNPQGATSTSGLTPNQAYDAIRSQYLVTDPDTKKSYITKNKDERKNMIAQIIALGMPDAQTDQLAAALGITSKEWQDVTGVPLGE